MAENSLNNPLFPAMLRLLAKQAEQLQQSQQTAATSSAAPPRGGAHSQNSNAEELQDLVNAFITTASGGGGGPTQNPPPLPPSQSSSGNSTLVGSVAGQQTNTFGNQPSMVPTLRRQLEQARRDADDHKKKVDALSRDNQALKRQLAAAVEELKRSRAEAEEKERRREQERTAAVNAEAQRGIALMSVTANRCHRQQQTQMIGAKKEEQQQHVMAVPIKIKEEEGEHLLSSRKRERDAAEGYDYNNTSRQQQRGGHRAEWAQVKKEEKSSNRQLLKARTPSLTAAEKRGSLTPTVEPVPLPPPMPPAGAGGKVFVSLSESIPKSQSYQHHRGEAALHLQHPHRHDQQQQALVASVPTSKAPTTRSPSPVDPRHGPDIERNFVLSGFPSAGGKHGVNALTKMITDLGGKVLVSPSDVPPPPAEDGTTMTHVLIPDPGQPKSVKALCGVAGGKFVVTPGYVVESAVAGFWLDEEEPTEDADGEDKWVCLRVFPPPLRGRKVYVPKDTATRSHLVNVLQYGGAIVVDEPKKRSNSNSGHNPRSREPEDVITLKSGDELLNLCFA